MKRISVFSALTAAVIASLAGGCATDGVPIDGIVIQPLSEAGPDGSGALAVTSYVAPPTGEGLRIRINGEYLIWEMDDGYQYAEISEPGAAVGAWLPVGSYTVELVDRKGAVWVTAPPVAVYDQHLAFDPEETAVFFYGPRATAQAWTVDPTPHDSDASTIELRVRNILDEPVVVQRCGAGGCTAVATVAAGTEASLMTSVAVGGNEQLGIRFAGGEADQSFYIDEWLACPVMGFLVAHRHQFFDADGHPLSSMPVSGTSCRKGGA